MAYSNRIKQQTHNVMKTSLLLLVILFVLVGNARAEILVLNSNGTSAIKTTLEIARTAADAAGKTVVVTSALTSSESNIIAEWPADRALKIEIGGRISNSTAFRITGPFSAGIYQVFSGSGAVTFGSGTVSEVYPEWWGVDGTADDVEINKALQSQTHGVKVVLSNKTYNITSTITRGSAGEYPYSLVGKGVYDGLVSSGTRLNWVGGNSNSVLKVFGFSVIKDITIVNGNSATGIVGLDCSGVYPATPHLWRTNFVLENIMVKACATGFKFDYCGLVNGTRLGAYYCTSYGFDIRTEANHLTFNNCVANSCAIGVTDKNGSGSRSVTWNGFDVERNTKYGLDLGSANSFGWVMTNLYSEANTKLGRISGHLSILGAFLNESSDIPLDITGCREIRIENLFVRDKVTQLLEITGSDASYLPNSLYLPVGYETSIIAKSIINNPKLLSNGILNPSSYSVIETDWVTVTSANNQAVSIIGENFKLGAANPRKLVAMYMVVKTAVTFSDSFSVGVGKKNGYVDMATKTFSTGPVAVGVYNIPVVGGAALDWYSYTYNYLTSSTSATAGSVKFLLFFV